MLKSKEKQVRTRPVDSTNLPREEFFTTEMTVRDSPCTKNRDRIAGVTASSCRFT